MRKFVFILSVLLTLMCTNAIAGETWVVASLEWAPYCGISMDKQGKSIEKLREGLKGEGIELLVEFYPWQRAKMTAKSDSYVGYFPAWTAEIDPGFIASVPIDNSEVAVIKLKGTEVKFNNLFELFQNYKVGVVRGYGYPNSVAKAMKAHPTHVDEANDEVLLLRKMYVSRYPVIISDPLVTQYAAAKEKIEGVEVVQSISKEPLVMAVREGEGSARKLEILKRAFGE